MSRVVVGYLTLVVLSLFASSLRAADGPSPDVPELKALEHYLGNWDVVFQTANLPFKKGEASAKWILGGRYLEQTGAIQSADGAMNLTVTTIMTYDVEKKAYRSWTFSSNGTNNQSDSSWDEKTKTFTSVTKPDANGITTTVTADFSTKDVEVWKFVVKERSGNVLEEFQGKNTRRK